MSSGVRLASVFIALALCAGCKEEPPRSRTGPGIEADPLTEKLARRVVGERKDATELSPLSGQSVQRGPLVISARELQVSQSIKGAKTSLTSLETFLGVELVLVNSAEHDVALDLSLSMLKSADGESFEIARDAQALAGTRELALVLAPKERLGATLYFELPQAALAPGLELVLPEGDGTLPLQ